MLPKYIEFLWELLFSMCEGKVKSSPPGPKMAFQLVKVYVSCLRAHLISSYDKL